MPGQQARLTNWLAVKKRGRDDAQIEVDRKKAVEAKRRARSNKSVGSKQAATKPPSAKVPSRKQPQRRKKVDSDSDYNDDGDRDSDSMNDFLVGSDEEVSQAESSSEEELEITESRPKRMKASAAPVGVKFRGKERAKNEEPPSTDNDSSSDEGLSSFLTPFKARKSRPSKQLQRASLAAKNRPNKALQAPSRLRGQGRKRMDLLSSATKSETTFDSSEELTSPSPVKKNGEIELTDDSDSDVKEGLTKSKFFAAKRRKSSKKALAQESDKLSPVKQSRSTSKKPRLGKQFSDDSSEEATHEVSRNKSLKPVKTAASDNNIKKQQLSGGVQQRSYSLVDSSEDEDFSRVGNAPKKITKKKKSTNVASSKPNRRNHVLLDESSDEDLPVALDRSMDKESDIENHLITNDESLDEDEENAILWAVKESTKETNTEPKDNNVRLRRKNETKSTSFSEENEDAIDVDEENAIQEAIEESKKEARKQQKRTKGIDPESVSDNEIHGILDETSGEEEDHEEEYEEQKKAASSILQTAEQLSSQVLRTMKGWMNEEGSSESAPQGMIMDGAISLASLQTSKVSASEEASRHDWISQKDMEKACPDVKLADYQLVGVNWLTLLHGMKCQIEGNCSTNVNGILADEMGLGKTVQTIAFLAWLKYRSETVLNNDVDMQEKRMIHLVVVPVSVMPNWMREFKTFCPQMNVVKYHGSLAERKDIQDTLRQYLPKNQSRRTAAAPLDVILTPITYFQKEKSDDRKFLLKFKYEYLVVDEAHLLKNAQSTRYKMLNRVSTRHRLLLTGTPVQNSPIELLNMLCFLMPLFSRGGENPFEDGAEKCAGDRMLEHFVDLKGEGTGDEYAYEKLKKLFAPFVLRRKKADVLAQAVPPKERKLELVELDKFARDVYNSILADHINKNGDKVTAAIGENLFTNLRKAAHHPLLLRTLHNTPEQREHLTTYFHQYGAFQGDGNTKARVAEELSRFNDFNVHVTALELIEENPLRSKELQRYVLEADVLFSSAKFKRLRSIVPQLIADGHRILIFSSWTSCLDLLGCLMEYLDLKYLRMDGSTPAAERQERIDHFNENNSIPVFLLSTKACGIGINLTAADTCIIHDLDFNPFNDLQAEDRCHRIGQTRKVTVIKLVTKDTVDADIYQMQDRKAKMNAAIMESKEDKKAKKDMLLTAVNRYLDVPKNANPSGNNTKKKQKVISLV